MEFVTHCENSESSTTSSIIPEMETSSQIVELALSVERADTAALLGADESSIDTLEKKRLEEIRQQQISQAKLMAERRQKKAAMGMEQRQNWEQEIERYRIENEEVEERQRRLDIEETMNEFYPKLCEWVGLSNYEVLYNSVEDGTNASDFNKKVCGEKNVMFIIITKTGYAFGCFCHKKIPYPKKSYIYSMYDKKYFTFSLRNPSCSEPIYFKQKHQGKSICIWPNDEQNFIFTTKRFIKIKNPNGPHGTRSFFHGKFSLKYKSKDHQKREHTFFTQTTAFDVHRLVVLHWF
ncbi:hypothetical protein EHI8A_017240 [Entamoeba histolytica HM-1:IMSS-B]|uniref:TLDc domain-containing protein n=6 Tax=Entamoeba histolytica TaxID=5759 RepID=C4LY52_ENTH1|nr:hypothetical protein EHI_177490 [Entamoeba histolytica HM-1:IMSS]EMD46880.1 Hypothetical protein EHI5A_031740 [Entamoeba histolytica KU27]EMH75741.1 hypothetical protein EHI8A_017240 [Entamoeba histolytica HM-1:IMSS-B]EMS17561.1 hypothetical protein KM1_046690 [Entamoeba histolytica HM-3:IMSS]ENY65159.1 hypothetical protein EHI7A_018500 [Entamoeba histolytica HM-1:IMSS-A]GAT93706.1 hypothetical protein CL6EHI_177490 [Entamoeba histolytica]|eukprot:XP_655919.1 hypothetical protein EHI_177490 [Entamoeba histolytica HM-1:IMSS]